MAGYPPQLPSFAATRSAAVVPSDTVGVNFNALYIGVAGDVTLTTPDGNTTLFKAVPVGILWVAGTFVKATGTAATNIVALG